MSSTDCIGSAARRPALVAQFDVDGWTIAALSVYDIGPMTQWSVIRGPLESTAATDCLPH